MHKPTKIMKPDFSRCSVNIIASIKKHFNSPSQYPTLPELDSFLDGVDHIQLVLLDGMGSAILEGNLEQNSFLHQHHICDISSIFPPTTVAATTSIISGMLPGQTGWIGWHQYFSDVDRHVVMFKDEDYYTLEHLGTDFALQRLPITPFFQSLPNTTSYAMYPSFKVGGHKRFKNLVKELVHISKRDEKSFTYAYWDQPDYTIHEFGCYHKQVKKELKKLDKVLTKMTKSLGDRTCMIITADHGLVDVEPIKLYDFPEVVQYLHQLPSLEGRATVFYVKDKVAFATAFNHAFSSWFALYETEAFLEEGFLGFPYELARPFLGDFIAIATDKYFFQVKDDVNVFKGAHAGLTEDEVRVPLIIFKK